MNATAPEGWASQGALIAEDEATGRVKALYDEIKSELGIDFVPNLYRAMASNPDYLEANWRKESEKISRRTADYRRRISEQWDNVARLALDAHQP